MSTERDTWAFALKTAFPFAAMVGQEEMKLALMMAAADPGLGGVLIFGDRGTGKSTAVRALAQLLRKIKVREGCAYNCEPDAPAACCQVCNLPKPNGASHPGPKRPPKIVTITAPMVDLPLGSTEDRVCGALDIKRALMDGEKAFEPGLLAGAHRGFLYIDEVNLLEDHLVDLLLDVAASGENVVEREGLSIRHPARFVLVGSGNPEEGELRPQLLDRFGLSVEVSSPTDLGERMEVVRRREAFERDPAAFADTWHKEQQKLGRKLARAGRLVAEVEVPDKVLEQAARLCIRLGVDGLRGELTVLRAAKARAALAGRKEANLQDVVAVAPMALRHRLRRDPLDEAGSSARVDRAVEEMLAGAAGYG